LKLKLYKSSYLLPLSSNSIEEKALYMRMRIRMHGKSDFIV